MKSFFVLAATCSAAAVAAFVPSLHHGQQRLSTRLVASVDPVTDVGAADELLLDKIAHKLRLQVYDDTTGVYGIESKDRLYGIENIHTTISMDDNGWLGLELTEVAHSDLDHRGLVLVSKVTGHALHDTPIHVGDVIIGVWAGNDFKESTTGLDYDDTVDVISRAKKRSLENGGHGRITLELNRLVKRATVNVQVEGTNKEGEVITRDIQGLAGDNLRLLLQHNKVNLYDATMPRLDQPHMTGDCGGEGICGTCMVAVQQGMQHLNKVGPQEQSLLDGRPESWRAACKTVIGADNQEDTTLRVRLYPHLTLDDTSKETVRP